MYATDSVCSGWTAQISTVASARPARVRSVSAGAASAMQRRRNASKRSAQPACTSTLSAWKLHGSWPLIARDSSNVRKLNGRVCQRNRSGDVSSNRNGPRRLFA